MKITNLTIDGTECELGFGVDGKLYLLSNFANLQGLLKKYKWEDLVSYGQCSLEITKAEQLALFISNINDIYNTNFSLEFISIKASSIRHKNDNIKDVIFKSNNGEIYRIRLILDQQNEYVNEHMRQCEKEFILKISSILYWIYLEKNIKIE